MYYLFVTQSDGATRFNSRHASRAEIEQIIRDNPPRERMILTRSQLTKAYGPTYAAQCDQTADLQSFYAHR